MQLECVIAYGAFGGRMDHVFANINNLYTAYQQAPEQPVYLMDGGNIACLLQKVMYGIAGLSMSNCIEEFSVSNVKVTWRTDGK